jgi:diguanylate cyclase (GGDEF)-like protein
VHVTRMAQDGTLGRGTVYRPGTDWLSPDNEYVIPMDERSAVREVARTGAPVIEPDARNSRLLSTRLVERFAVASALFVPLTYEGEVRCVAVLVSERPHRFSDEEVQLVHTLANQACAALVMLEMKQRLSARADSQAALVRAASALNAKLDQRAVLDTLCEEADRALGGDLAGVYLGDALSGGVGVAAHGMPDDTEWYGYVIEPGEGVGGQVLATGQPVVSNAYQADVKVPEIDTLRSIQTAVSVPVCWDGRLRGALSVAFYTMRRITAEDLASLQAIADLAAVACSNAEAFEQVKEAAQTDSLTGLLNHGAVQGRLRQEIARARRQASTLWCLLMDLDNFKPINDELGHLVGDRLLGDIAVAVSTELRPYDGIGRFGGDEFVLILPGATESGALDVAVRLRRIVNEAGADLGALGADLTVSIGIARWLPPLTAGQLLERADQALRLAKRRGKQRAVVACHETEEQLAQIELGPAARAP